MILKRLKSNKELIYRTLVILLTSLNISLYQIVKITKKVKKKRKKEKVEKEAKSNAEIIEMKTKIEVHQIFKLFLSRLFEYSSYPDS